MISFAVWEQRPQLSALWQECFGDPEAVPACFLEHLFSPRDCLVDTEDGQLASAVYLIPAGVLVSGKKEQAHYIFAAATSPRYRSRGLMSALLARAAEVGEGRGDRWSAVLPADDGLYRFYASAGYSDFFTARIADVPAECLGSAAAPADFQPDWAALSRCRGTSLAGNGGSLLWSSRVLAGAAAMHRAYGDRLVFAGEASCAVCRTTNKVCTVLESFAPRGGFPALAAAVLRDAPAERYRFRLPAGSDVFTGEGTLCRFGMLKGLGGRTPAEAKPRLPYLGFGMD